MYNAPRKFYEADEPQGGGGDFDDDEFNALGEFCPNCGREYDEIDFEYQICHVCKFNNNPKKEDHV